MGAFHLAGLHARRWLWLARVAGCLLIAPAAFNAFAGPSGPAPYVVSDWEMKDSLPLSRIRAVVQTHDGFLWLAAASGLARYDGYSFKLFNKANTPGLPDSAINCLYGDRAGNLWVGSDTGELGYVRLGKFERLKPPKDWPKAPIIQVVENREAVWVLNRLGDVVAIGAGSPVVVVHHDDAARGASPEALRLIRDAAGGVWLARGSSVCALAGGEGGKKGAGMEIPRASPGVIIFAARTAGFWVIDGSWLHRWDHGEWVEDRGRHNWGEVIASLPMETASGDVLVPTLHNDCYIIDRRGLEKQPANSSGAPRDPVCCVCEDFEGNIWVGTESGGLNILRPRAVNLVEPPDHWMNQRLFTVAANREDGIFIGTERASVYFCDRGVFTGVSRIRGAFDAAVRCLYADSRNALWVGTAGAGLWRESQGAFLPAGPLAGPKQINAIFETQAHEVWFGTEAGPLRLAHDEWRLLSRDFALVQPDTRCFAEGPDGAIWFGMQGGGLGRFLNGQVKQYFQSNGLASDFIWSLLAEPDGTLWVGTYGGGLGRLKNGKLSTVSTKSGLPSDVICSILDDEKGNFWMSSYSGVFEVSKAALTQCAEGKSKSVNCLVLGFDEGLITLEMSGGCQPAACRTPDGRLWFPSSKGLAMVDPGAIRNNVLPPRLAIDELLVGGQPVDLEKPGLENENGSPAPVEIGPGRRNVEIRYLGLSFTSRERIRFRYRMEGLETDWTEAGSRRSAYYNYLPAGEYLFRVLACNNSGIWNETGATVALSVRPYIWERWWFLGAGGLGIMATAALTAVGISRRRERKKREELERQRVSEQERTRIARDIHDQLGIGLTRISMLSQSAGARETLPAGARENVVEIYETTNELTRAMDEIVWAVNPHHDTLEGLLTYLVGFARKFLETAEIRCRLDLPMEVPAVPLSAEVRHHIFLAFQEVLNNVVKHAVASEVSVTAALQGTHLVISVADNGKGFECPQAGRNGHEGDGISNMRQRLEETGGTFECDSRPGAGTTIRLVIPIKT